jgi:peptide/nickel transport system permease protein
MLSRLIWGARVSIAVGVAATLVAALIGSTIGLIAAYFGRITDNVLMRGVDMLMAFPYLLLALAIVAALGPGLMNALLAIAVVNIPFFARSVRGATLGLVNREFIEAAGSPASPTAASSSPSSCPTCCRSSSSPCRPRWGG